MTIDPTKARVFREELAELYERYGLKVSSICCSERIEPVPRQESSRQEALDLDVLGLDGKLLLEGDVRARLREIAATLPQAKP